MWSISSFFFFFQSFLLFVKLQRSPSIYKHVKLTIKPGLLSPNTKARVDMNSASCRRNSLWRFPCFIWKNKFKTIHISTHTYVFILVSVFFCFCFFFFIFVKYERVIYSHLEHTKKATSIYGPGQTNTFLKVSVLVSTKTDEEKFFRPH